ncbi:MAG TPA: DUF58 domain-containing protein [Myxococcota bacterium]|jgi:uncharacterized protein (DUF58 family)
MPAPRWLRRLARGLDWAPLAAPGAVLAALAGVALWYYGFRELDLLLLVAAVACFAVLALCALAVVATALALRRWLRETPPAALPERIETDVWLRTGFALPDWPLPWISFALRWQEPAGVACRLLPRVGGGAWLEEIRASRRAELARVERVIEVRDVFGLTRVRVRDARPARTWILPNPHRLVNAPPVITRAGGEGVPHPSGTPEGDRADIRRYAPGDSARDVLWKTFARTGLLMVRKPERALEPARQVSAYLMADPRDEAAAAAARIVLESGALGEGWRFGADGARAVASTLGDALHAVVESGAARGPTQLGAFLDGASRADPCIVFAPAHDGPWRAQALRCAERHGPRLSFVLGAHGVTRAQKRSRLEALLLTSERREGVLDRELRALAAQLAAHGGEVRVLDRSTGAALDAQGGALA